MVYTFNPQPFIEGIEKINKSTAGMEKKMGNMVQSISKGVMSAVAKIGLIAGAFKGIQGIVKQIPEIGQAFEIAKNEIMKNLLWPLRQAVMPLLQKMLDWVRDNRGMFVKWGMTLVNIFNTVIKVGSEFFGLLSKIWNTISGLMGNIFGVTVKNMDQAVNILSFKLTAAIMLISTLIDSFVGAMKGIEAPVKNIISNIMDIAKSILKVITGTDDWSVGLNKIASAFGTLLKSATEIVSKFTEGVASVFKGFAEGFNKNGGLDAVFKPLKNILADIQSIMKTIFGSDTDIMKGLKVLGEFIGGVFVNGLIAAAAVLNTISYLAGNIVRSFALQDAMSKNDMKRVKELQAEGDAANIRQGQTMEQLGGAVGGLLGMKPERFAQLATGDTSTTNKNTTINLGGITVHAGDTITKDQAQELAEKIYAGLHVKIQSDLLIQGRLP
jgi:phage-related protein